MVPRTAQLSRTVPPSSIPLVLRAMCANLGRVKLSPHLLRLHRKSSLMHKQIKLSL